MEIIWIIRCLSVKKWKFHLIFQDLMCLCVLLSKKWSVYNLYACWSSLHLESSHRWAVILIPIVNIQYLTYNCNIILAPYYFIFHSSQLHRCSCMLIGRRTLTSSEVSTALRPFYFNVHPDLFGQFPNERVSFVNRSK